MLDCKRMEEPVEGSLCLGVNLQRRHPTGREVKRCPDDEQVAGADGVRIDDALAQLPHRLEELKVELLVVQGEELQEVPKQQAVSQRLLKRGSAIAARD